MALSEMALSRLYFITMDGARVGPLEQITAACRAGIRSIQLRMKEASDAEFMETAVAAMEICAAHGCPLIINDRVVVAAAVGAHGVHVGKEDVSVREARRILGAGKIVGGTANTVEDIREHYRGGADYIGFGPFRYTTTKRNLSPVVGLEGYRRVMEQLRVEGIPVPVWAIGGIGAGDVGALLEAGVYGVAFSGMLVHSADPAGLVRGLEEETARVLDGLVKRSF
jgi:thiamine-phosphate pyrophosphorylase